jgi:hypothetical protein
MMHSKSLSAPACLLAAVLLAGCAQTPIGVSGKEPSPPTPRANVAVHASRTEPAGPAIPADPAQVALRDGIAAYDNGDYQGAVKKLSAREIAKSSKANQLIAIKYTAFSYCVSGRPALCRQQFDKALKLDPAFELEVGETGHPLWGPVFARAKKSNMKVEKSAPHAGRALQ